MVKNSKKERPRPKQILEIDAGTALFIITIALLLPLLLTGFFS